MYKNRKMLLSLIFILLLSNIIYAQENLPKKTTSTEKVQTEQNIELKAESNQTVTEGTSDQKSDAQQEKNKKKMKKEEGDESSQVKQVKGSKPDMSKAKGARPPYIVRPSGAGMPKGAGKPGGAVRPGRR
jgi:hypothetical protein